MKKRFISLVSLCLLCALVLGACGVPLNLSGIDPDALFTTMTTKADTTPSASESDTGTEPSDASSTEPSSAVTEPSSAQTSATTPTETTTTENTVDDLPELSPSESTNRFTVSNAGVLTAYNGADTVLTIPEIVDGYTVTSIAENVFAGNTTITKVVLPAGLSTIGGGAFKNCTALREISFANVTSIGEQAFAGCTALPIAYLANGITTVGASAFAGCTNLVLVLGGNGSAYDATYKDETTPVYTNVATANYVTTANGLHYIVEGSTVTIARFVFTNSGVMHIPSTLSEKSVTKIGEMAFHGEKGLTQVTIPDTISTLAAKAFYGCTKLEMMYYNTDVLTLADETNAPEELYNNRVMYGIGTETTNGLTIKFGDNVTKIPNYIFQSDATVPTNISKLYIGKGMTKFLPVQSFKGTALKYVYFNAVAMESALDNNTTFFYISTERGALDVVIGKDVTVVPDYLFSGVSAIRSLTFETGSVCQTIGACAFRECTALTEVTFPTSVQTICDKAFEKVPLTTVVLPSVVTIGDSAFRNNTGLTYVVLPSTLTSIQQLSFFKLPDGFIGIFFYGDADAWNNLVKDFTNTGSPLHPTGTSKAAVYFYSETETADGWHMVEGVPTPWTTA